MGKPVNTLKKPKIWKILYMRAILSNCQISLVFFFFGNWGTDLQNTEYQETALYEGSAKCGFAF